MSTAREFLREIIDYAGLFPPASHDMAHAVASFAEYADGNERDLLGRFVLPSTRLDEFQLALEASRPVLTSSASWRISLIPSAATKAEAALIRQFNQARKLAGTGVKVRIDAIEMPVRSVDEVHAAAAAFGKFKLFLEPVGADDPTQILDGVAAVNAAAKIRTGGTVPGSTPAPETVIRFIERCSNLGLKFKATAGLHHALRNVYPLTYAADSPSGTMYGYLNIFLVAAFMKSGLPRPALLDLLQESDAKSISFEESGVVWGGHVADTAHLRETRENFALSFGSCSFTEPVEEARQLHLI